MERQELLSQLLPSDNHHHRSSKDAVPGSIRNDASHKSDADFPPAPLHTQAKRSLTAYEKLGRFCLAGLLSSAIAHSAAIGFLIFLWSGPSTDQNWVLIVTTNWATRGVTVSALFIRFGASVLTGFAGSMLAAIVLESGTARTSATASLSIMRSAAPSTWQLLQSVGTSGGLVHGVVPLQTYFVLALLLLGINLALQFSSTILLSDLRLGEVAGLPNVTTYKYDVAWEWSQNDTLASFNNEIIYGDSDNRSPILDQASPWTQTPLQFPVFGEYREPIPLREGVDDTGYLLRAFLPFSDPEQRQTVSSFRGESFVLDSRVSCQKPVITNLGATISGVGGIRGPAFWASLNGTVSNSTQIPDLWFPRGSNLNISFGCQTLVGHFFSSPYLPDDMAVGLCQIQGENTTVKFLDKNDPSQVIELATEGAGSLRSRLFNYTLQDNEPSHGPAYLVIIPQPTEASDDDSEPRPVKLEASSTFTASVKWNSSLDFNNTYPGFRPNTTQDFLISLCYTSWTSSNTIVDLTGGKARREPDLGYSNLSNVSGLRRSVRFDAPLLDYGVGDNGSRSTLAMQKPFYIQSLSNPIQQPSIINIFGDLSSLRIEYVIDLSMVSATSENGSFRERGFWDWTPYVGGRTGFFYPNPSTFSLPQLDAETQEVPRMAVIPNPSIRSFFMQAMQQSNKSIATSLSSLFTLISSMTYYSQFPVLSKNGTAEIAFFQNVLYPHTLSGLLIVIALIVTHCILVAFIIFLFLSNTKYTRLGQAWMAVAQVFGVPTEDLLRHSSVTKDSKVDKKLKESGREFEHIRIADIRGDGDVYGCVVNEGNNRVKRRGFEVQQRQRLGLE